MNRSLFAPMVLFCLLSASVGSAQEADSGRDWRPAPLSAEFRAWQERGADGDWIPTPFRLPGRPAAVPTSAPLPTAFDLRGEHRVSPVKDQGRYYTCQSFATCSALESVLLPWEPCDFSEWHIAKNHGFDIGEGGNMQMNTAYMTRWNGPVNEADAPYGGPGSYPSAKPARHLQQVLFVPPRNGPLDNDTIKWFIMNYGALYTSIYIHFDYFALGGITYYYPYAHAPNHGVAVVGWLDDYPAANFRRRPPGDGAFIVKNSWGTSFGDGGYMYISYYDPNIQVEATFNGLEEVYNYGTNYQHDFYGFTFPFGGDTTSLWGANVFTAVNDEPLAAVGLYLTEPGARVSITVYRRLRDGSPLSGEATATAGIQAVYAGYHTIPLNTAVPLNAGERFSVVVHWENPQYLFPLPVEAPIPRYSSRAQAAAGESFVSRDGLAWTDLTTMLENSNLCIKAFTRHSSRIFCGLSSERLYQESWLIRRVHGRITLRVEDPAATIAFSAALFRRRGQETAVKVLTTALDRDERHTWTADYYEKNLDTGVGYSYQMVLYDRSGAICAKSAEVQL